MGILFRFVRDEIFKLQPGTMIGVVIKSDAINQQSFNVPEFVVFQARVTPTFEVEHLKTIPTPELLLEKSAVFFKSLALSNRLMRSTNGSQGETKADCVVPAAN